MQFNLTTLIVIAVATMFFGYFFGLFEGRGQGYNKRKNEEAKEKQNVGERPTVPPVEPVSPAQQPLPPAIKDNPGLLRLKEENGRVVLDLDGKPVGADMITIEQRKRLIEVITHLRPWIEGIQASPTMSTSPTAPRPAPVTPAAPPRPVAAPTAPAKKEESPQTMVGQIDAILQQKIANTPLAEIGLMLKESPGGGVNVIVGDKQYEGISGVPIPEVQAAIRAAIAAWEKKYTPG